ncbi:MAG TPA: hemolysin family protein [Thermotogota bacterium]|nr:hemolysin family protein [Thermotogota bacterium]
MEPEPGSTTWQLILLVFLLYLSGFFSGSETALTSVSKLKIKQMIEKSGTDQRKKILSEALHRPNRLLTTILVLNNFVNILASSMATLFVMSLFPEGETGIAAGIATGFMTFFILIFGEITPKVYSTQQAERVFRRNIPVITFASYLLSPVITFLVWISNLFLRLLGGHKVKEPPFITEDEIVFAMHVGAQEGAIEPEEKQMLTRALELKDTTVREIMIPRVDMVALEESHPLSVALQLIKEEGYSRFPVYRESIDNVSGILYAKDILKVMHERGRDVFDKLRVKEISRLPFFIPETKRINDLLQEFQNNMVHMAIVVDEYGGTEGLVTIEDIIEEVMGEILDEFDEGEEVGIEKTGKNTYIVDSKIPINDIERQLEIHFPETEFETLGGYLLELFERVPRVGEEIDVNGFHFRILAASKSRIEKVRFIIKHRESIDSSPEIPPQNTKT